MEIEKVKPKEVVKKVSQLDLEILYGLYKFRALSTDHIKRRYQLTDRYTYRKIEILRNTGWIISEPISGYTRKQRRQGSYHRISETGIDCLRKQGYSVERKATTLRVRKRMLPFLLHAYDVFISLEPFGWQFIESRDTKHRFNMNRNERLQGILISPNGEQYVFYSLLETTNEKTLALMGSEISSHNNNIREKEGVKDKYKFPMNYIIFANGKESLLDCVEYFKRNQDIVSSTQQISIVPPGFAKNYYRLFYDKEEEMNFILQTIGAEDVTSVVYPTLRKYFKGLDTIVEHDGEEKYLVSLLDNNLKTIIDVSRYRKEFYQDDRRKVLLVVPTVIEEIAQEAFELYHHIEIISVRFTQYIANQIRKTKDTSHAL